jgi:hypothetical protein
MEHDIGVGARLLPMTLASGLTMTFAPPSVVFSIRPVAAMVAHLTVTSVSTTTSSGRPLPAMAILLAAVEGAS